MKVALVQASAERENMFDKFGEIDSAEELNNTAAGFLEEGDTESLLEFAKENGIDVEDAQDYIDGVSSAFATSLMAAYGKLDVEAKENIDTRKNMMEKMPLQLIMAMTRGMCAYDMDIVAAVRQKGKRNTRIYELIREIAKEHQIKGESMACGTDRQLNEIIRTYYMESEEKCMEVIEKLYEE